MKAKEVPTREDDLLGGCIEICGRTFGADRVWRLPMKKVENTELLAIQSLFDIHDICHTSAENTMLHLVQLFGGFQLLWACKHFEDACFIHMAQICGIMADMALMSFVEEPIYTAVAIEFLDITAEKLIISIDVTNGNVLY